MRLCLVLCWLILLAAALPGQSSRNPFELTDRLPAGEAGSPLQDSSANPFDIRRSLPRELPDRIAGPVVVAPGGGDGPGGSVIFIHLLLLVTMASLWVLFRDLLGQCLSAIFNENVMTQLYRRHSGGQVGALTLCYFFFLLSAGFFIYLFAMYYGVSLRLGIWGSWLTYTLLVMAGTGLKFVVLLILGRIYPLRKELSHYVFALMVFSIIAGLVLVPINLLISYAPAALHSYFLYGGLVVLLLIYFLHLLRGLFIANRYVGSRPLHFLLYLCTIEIAPILLVYRYLHTTL